MYLYHNFLTISLIYNMQNRWLYPYDAEADTMKRWNEVSAVTAEELRKGEIVPLFEGGNFTPALELHTSAGLYVGKSNQTGVAVS